MVLRENWVEFRVLVIFILNYKNFGGEKNLVIIEVCYFLFCFMMSWGSCNYVIIKIVKNEVLGCNYFFIWFVFFENGMMLVFKC